MRGKKNNRRKQSGQKGPSTARATRAMAPTTAAALLAPHIKSPVFKAAPQDTPLDGDPWLPASKTQYLLKTDTCQIKLTGTQCVSQSVYSACGGAAKRVVWVPPFIVKQPDNGTAIGETQVDSRGVFADISRTRVTFKNVTKQPIKVVLNSPRGRITDPGTIYLRRYKRDIEIAPGQTRSFGFNWGDRANIFTPYTQTMNVGGDAATDTKSTVFGVCDFAVVVPDVDEMSGKNFKELASMIYCVVDVEQRFLATGFYNISDYKVATRSPIAVTKLAAIKDMMYEAPLVLKTRVEEPLVLKTVAGFQTLHGSAGPYVRHEQQGMLVTIAGCYGYYKNIGGNYVLWDVAEDRPAGPPIDPVAIPKGAEVSVVPGLDAIKVADIIAFLTTITKILMVVSSFV